MCVTVSSISSFWGYNLWDADHDGKVSQADVLRTIGYMGLMNQDGLKLVTDLFSSYARWDPRLGNPAHVCTSGYTPYPATRG